MAETPQSQAEALKRLLSMIPTLPPQIEPRPLLSQTGASKHSLTVPCLTNQEGMLTVPFLPPSKRTKVCSQPEPERSPKIVVLDIDETLGFFQRLSLFYNVYRHYTNENPSCKKIVEEHFKKCKVVRPGVDIFIKMLVEMKKSGRIDSIVIFTAASNKCGWVDFITGCLAEFAEIEKPFDRIIAAEDCTSVRKEGRLIKDLKIVDQDITQILMIDDKPDWILGENIYGIPEYTVDSKIDYLVDLLPFEYRKDALMHIGEDMQKFPLDLNVVPAECDKEIFQVMKEVDAFFPSEEVSDDLSGVSFEHSSPVAANEFWKAKAGAEDE